jgi:phosphopantetheinyl transferase (holo-ACP synthase)
MSGPVSTGAVGVWSIPPRRALDLLARHPQAMTMVFTDAEAAELLREPFNPVSCAMYWAVKEAALRALALPPRLRCRWRDVQVDLDGTGGGPRIGLRGEVAAYARSRGVRRMDAAVRRRDGRLVATVVAGGGPARRCEITPLRLAPDRPAGAPARRSPRSLRGDTR